MNQFKWLYIYPVFITLNTVCVFLNFIYGFWFVAPLNVAAIGFCTAGFYSTADTIKFELHLKDTQIGLLEDAKQYERLFKNFGMEQSEELMEAYRTVGLLEDQVGELTLALGKAENQIHVMRNNG